MKHALCDIWHVGSDVASIIPEKMSPPQTTVASRMQNQLSVYLETSRQSRSPFIRQNKFLPSSPSSKMLGGGMSMIFFKTKGQDFSGADAVVFPLGWSATVTAALPGIVHCGDVPIANDTDSWLLQRRETETVALQDLFWHLSLLLSTRTRFGNTTHTSCSLSPPKTLVGYS